MAFVIWKGMSPGTDGEHHQFDISGLPVDPDKPAVLLSGHVFLPYETLDSEGSDSESQAREALHAWLKVVVQEIDS